MANVFLVDDNRTQRKIISTALKTIENISLTQFDSSVDLIKSAKSSCPDLIITDFVLPDITGLELISKVKRTNKDCRYIIITSGFETSLLPQNYDHSHIEEKFQCPIVYKPISQSLLHNTVKSVLDGFSECEKVVISSKPSDESLSDAFFYHVGEKVYITEEDGDRVKVAKIKLKGYGCWIEKENLK